MLIGPAPSKTRIIYRIAVCIAACSLLPGCGRQEKTLLFFCGSAVRVPMDEIIASYQRETGERISVTYGGSGTLLSQMEMAR
ncbi:MAG: substrate-binding domain-containing protein, partial [Deltaproteobacteria bacterium]